jgi:glutamate-1-semialdehyde 2,1-aminomutase
MHAGIEGLRIFNEREVLRLNGLGEDLKRRVQKFFIKEGLYPESITDPSTDLIEIDSLESEDTMRAGDGQTLLHPPKMFITGKGSMLNVRFSGPDSQTWQALFYHHNLANGINIAARGYTPLNLCLSEEDIEKYISVIKAFVIRHRTELLRVELNTARPGRLTAGDTCPGRPQSAFG